MRHGSSRRQRNRGGNGRRGNQNRSQVYDSNGPDVRIRGTAHQVAEKYVALAKDAAAAGDPIMEQNYLQHAEHYQRIINSWGASAAESQSRQKTEDSSERSSQASKESEDLGLPASILGDAPSAAAEKQEEMAD